MAKYIELDVAKKAFQNMDAGRKHGSTLLTPEEFAEYLDELPIADVAPMRVGFWEIGGVNPANNVIGNFKCSLCKGTSSQDSDYCPNCGAKMEGVKNNERK